MSEPEQAVPSSPTKRVSPQKRKQTEFYAPAIGNRKTKRRKPKPKPTTHDDVMIFTLASLPHRSFRPNVLPFLWEKNNILPGEERPSRTDCKPIVLL